MSQRVSGYERREADYYPTPAWVVDALAEHVVLRNKIIWEPAAGEGQMVRALEAHGASVIATDLTPRPEIRVEAHDFTQFGAPLCVPTSAKIGVVTNPPYGTQGVLAEKFIERSLAATIDHGFVAMLLAVDFDSGSTRARFFADCPRFAGKIVLTKRIKWFEDPGKKSTPSANHAWFLWQTAPLGHWTTLGIWYAPRSAA